LAFVKFRFEWQGGVGAQSTLADACFRNIRTGERLPVLEEFGDAESGDNERWWQRAVIYEVALICFEDSGGDGKGDLRGLLGRVDIYTSRKPPGGGRKPRIILARRCCWRS